MNIYTVDHGKLIHIPLGEMVNQAPVPGGNGQSLISPFGRGERVVLVVSTDPAHHIGSVGDDHGIGMSLQEVIHGLLQVLHF